MSYAPILSVEYRGEKLQARALTGKQAEKILAMSTEDDSPAGGLRVMRYVVACCLLEDGKPVFQGEDDMDQVSSLPFSKIRCVSDHVMNEAGLGDTDAGN